jgi:glutathione S-transferase
VTPPDHRRITARRRQDVEVSTPDDDAPIHHLALPDDWAAAYTTGDYRPSTRGLSIDDVGFIHCSTRDQVESTANRFYADVDQLVLLTIDPAKVGSPIRYEPPTVDSTELFPHIYGPLPIAAVTDAKFWIRSAPGWTLD